MEICNINVKNMRYYSDLIMKTRHWYHFLKWSTWIEEWLKWKKKTLEDQNQLALKSLLRGNAREYKGERGNARELYCP